MPAYSGNIYTLADVAKRKEPNGSAVQVIEILSQTNDIISDAPAIECNNGTTHITTVRDSIPKPKFRMINQGTPSVKSGLRQTVENTGMIEAWSEVDQALLDICSDVTEKRSTLVHESSAILEGMSQAFVENIFYGNMATEPAGFDGFATRYNTLSGNISRNVVDAGGTGANLTSIYIVQWDPMACHVIYPKGTTSGITSKVFPGQILLDSAGNPFEGVRTKFTWYFGLAVRDWRRVVRICNIDTSQLDSIIQNGVPTPAGFALYRQLMYALDLLPNKGIGNTVIYTNRIPHTIINMMSAEKGNVNLTYKQPQGTPPIENWLGVPIRLCEGIIIGEDQVV